MRLARRIRLARHTGRHPPYRRRIRRRTQETRDEMSKRYVVRKPWDGEYNPETMELVERRGVGSLREYDAWLEDTASPGRVVHGDGGAPEDQTLLRDLSSLVDELNMLADALVQAEKLAASRYQQIEELKGQVAFQKAQADAYLTDKRIVQQQYDAFRVQVKEPSMTDTIEPTEEQMQAAKSFVHSEFGLAPSIQFLTPRIARLFAEREAALLALVQHAQMSSMARAADLDAARARIAELEQTPSSNG
jgi:hypothetical protein